MTASLISTVTTYQRDIAKHTELPRMQESHESLISGRQPYFSNMIIDANSFLPRQTPRDERRSSGQHGPPRPNFFRPPVPTHLNTSPRRFGSIGGPGSSPGNLRPLAQQSSLPPTQHPLASVSEPGMPGLGRRHTSADIRNTDGWPPHNASLFEHAPPVPTSATPWPSSPHRTPSAADQQVRDVLASYQIGGSSRSQSIYEPARGITPPTAQDHLPPPAAGSTTENGWNFGAPKFPPRLMDSAPPTRRSSMASNVHSLLNPAETVETEDEDGVAEERKRKRL